MRIYDIIEKKRNGEKLSKEEIYFFIDGYVKGEIPDYQISALLMAIYFSGMDDEETAVLTEAMMHSGDIIDLSEFGEFTVDKHSTGGVGDKTSLVIAPVMEALAVKWQKCPEEASAIPAARWISLNPYRDSKRPLLLKNFLSR